MGNTRSTRFTLKIYLSWNAPAFATRLLDEDLLLAHHPRLSTLGTLGINIPPPIEGLRAADHVRALILDNRLQREVPVMQPLEERILHVGLLLLKKLKRIDWTLPFYPMDMRFFDYLSFRCPDIEYVSFEISDHSLYRRISDQDLTSLFTFSELKHIQVKDSRLRKKVISSSHRPKLTLSSSHIAFDPETNGHISPALVNMIMRSPNLEYLELDLKEDPDDPQFLSAGWLVEAISPVLKHTFEHLKVFRLGGTANIDSELLLRPEEESLIRGFILRHPGLHTLQLPWDWDMNSLIREPIHETWMTLQGALPNLRCFEGPIYLVIIFLKLKLAQQLERLVVVDSSEDEESDLAKFIENFPRLPNLRVLELQSTYMLDTTSFSEIMKATPNITELTVNWVDGDPEATIQTLAGLKYLKSLAVGFNVMPHLVNRPYQAVPVQQELREVLQLAHECTSLEVVRILPEEGSKFDHDTRFYISRASNGMTTNINRLTMRRLMPVGVSPAMDLDLCKQKYRGFLGDFS
ncbi:hypothetical protein RHS04_00652 [Rhizoctonia solani]|uniref:A to I editase domain-containing protein n=1 Tax=Rhizoctonia solani TaxID=456999 RepID=A0A8H7LP18_9AGAM|nr:hypothetical protein RHS04_00652 [Rhizoctonia solani]